MSDLAAPVIEQKKSPVIAPPPRMYNVVVRNNSQTMQDFVVNMLSDVFNMSAADAANKMMEVHTKGRTNIGPYIRDIAEVKRDQCLKYAASAKDIRNRELLTTIEPVSP